MSAAPLVSVLTTFLNAERFLAEAVESVLAQRYPRWELLLVDDGSTDASAAIARGFAARDSARVRLVENPARVNRGISGARNVALAHARGELIAFLDADDVYVPHKLARQVELIEAHPCVSALYGSSRYWYGWTGRPADAARDHVPPLRVASGSVYDPPALLVAMLTRRATVPSINGLLVRRDALTRVGGFEERFRGLFEDQVIYAKLLVGGPVLAVDEWWDLYRQHDASCCAAAARDGSVREARLLFLRWLEAYAEARALMTPALRRALDDELRPYHHPRLARALEGVRRVARAARGAMRAGARVLPPPPR